MEAKEKAKEFVDKYLDVCEVLQYETKYMTVDMAKESAKIAVNELIEAFKQLSIQECGGLYIDFGHGYWESVLKEIDNI